MDRMAQWGFSGGAKEKRVDTRGRHGARSVSVLLAVFLVAAGAAGLAVALAGKALPLHGAVTTSAIPESMVYAPSSHELYVGLIDSLVVAYTKTNVVAATISVPSYPVAMAYDSADQSVYVVSYLGTSVSVINTSSNTVTTTIGVGSYPDGIAFDPATNAMYVANAGSDNVSIIATGSGVSTQSVGLPSGSLAEQVAYDAGSSDIYVAEAGANAVGVIDPTTNFLVAQVTTGISSPVAIAYDPADALVYVASTGTNYLNLIDSATNSVVGNISLGAGPGDLAYDPQAGDMAVTEPSFDQVALVGNTSLSGTYVATGSNPLPIVYDAASTRMYVGNQNSNTLSYFAGQSFTERAYATFGFGYGGMAYDPLRGEMIVASPLGGGTLGTTNATYLTWGGDFLLGKVPGADAILYDAAAKVLVVADGSAHNVSIVNASSLTLVQTVAVGLDPWALTLDTANGIVYVANNASGNVTGVNPVTGTTVANGPSVLSEPKSIVYDPADHLLYVADSTGGNISLLSPGSLGLVANVSLSGPTQVAYDPANHDVYAGAGTSSSSVVAVISSVSHHVAGVVALGTQTFTVQGLGYDVADGAMAVGGQEGLVWLSPSDTEMGYTYWGTLSVTASPTYDPTNGELYTYGGANYATGVEAWNS